MEKPYEPLTIITGYFDEPEYAVSDTDLITAITRLQQGEELWYRDYDLTGDKCISLYHCVRRITISEQDFYLFTMAQSDDDPFAQDAKLVGANIPTTYKQGCPDHIDTCQELALLEALKGFCEWTDYHGMMLVEKDTYTKHFSEN